MMKYTIIILLAFAGYCFGGDKELQEDCSQLPIAVTYEVQEIVSSKLGIKFGINFLLRTKAGFNDWTVLIKFKPNLLPPSYELHTKSTVVFNEDKSEVMVINKSGGLWFKASMEYFMMFKNMFDVDIENIFDSAMLFPTSDNVCFGLDYNLPDEKEEQIMIKDDEVLPDVDKCKDVTQNLQISNHLYGAGDKFNFRGSLTIREDINDWSFMIFFDSPVTSMQCWTGIATMIESEIRGTHWVVTPQKYNVNANNLRFDFIGAVEEKETPHGQVYFCNDGIDVASFFMETPEEGSGLL